MFSHIFSNIDFFFSLKPTHQKFILFHKPKNYFPFKMSTDTLNLTTLKNVRITKEFEEQKQVTRKRNILVLIWEYLQEMGYFGASRALECEVNLDLNQFSVCDNVDLDTILQEYETYYHVKFQKYPQIVKKVAKNDKFDEKVMKTRSITKPMGIEKTNQRRRINSCAPIFLTSDITKEPPGDNNALTLNGHQFNSTKKQVNNEPEVHLLKPLGLLTGYNDEWKELAAVISKDIYQKNPNVKWSDIIGLEDAKRLIKEAVVYPTKYPELFTGILSPWKGFLLFGPPGTGKTLLAKALATECKTTFFNISASSIVSKWRGDSEKLIRVLFDLAKFHAPSTIFIDEMDSIMTQRDSSGSHCEHEGSRRMKTELLIQMDGISKSEEMVFFLAASNLPWELDHALLRRLEKRILVDLPTESAREAIFKFYLTPNIPVGDFKLNCQLDYSHLAQLSTGYSGCDIMLVCKEAAMTRVRQLICLLDGGLCVDSLEVLKTSDVELALNKTKPSSTQFGEKYQSWNEQYGSV